MTRFILPTILVAITIALFFTFTQRFYGDITTLRAEQASYNEALDNSKALQSERDKLTQKYNNIGVDNLDKLKKLLPENVDNIRLILEIEKIGMPYGMILKDVKYNTATASADAQANQIQGGYIATEVKDYGTWDLEFSTAGTYSNLLNFINDLEHNLRIVDISSIDFSSDAGAGSKDTGVYTYKFKIKTYWLKN
ncbi:MAG: hypothetical protein V4486_02635 [Patescibacteria group bacterium]